MKNKRYKRLSKRIKGECEKRSFDDSCIEFETCPYSGFCQWVIVPLCVNIPMRTNKAELENLIKNNSCKDLFIE